MRKLVLLFAITVVAMLVSCQSEKAKPEKLQPAESTSTITNAVYEGVLPEADGTKMEYQLVVENLQDGKGSYQLHMVHVKKDGVKAEKTSSKGNLEVKQDVDKHAGKTVYTLKPDDGSETIYFIVKDEKTLRKLDKEMKEIDSVIETSYDIIRIK